MRNSSRASCACRFTDSAHAEQHTDLRNVGSPFDRSAQLRNQFGALLRAKHAWIAKHSEKLSRSIWR
jgi:hypothetical protein